MALELLVACIENSVDRRCASCSLLSVFGGGVWCHESEKLDFKAFIFLTRLQLSAKDIFVCLVFYGLLSMVWLFSCSISVGKRSGGTFTRQKSDGSKVCPGARPLPDFWCIDFGVLCHRGLTHWLWCAS